MPTSWAPTGVMKGHKLLLMLALELKVPTILLMKRQTAAHTLAR